MNLSGFLNVGLAKLSAISSSWWLLVKIALLLAIVKTFQFIHYRIAMLHRRVFSAALVRYIVVGMMFGGLFSLALLPGTQLAVATDKPQPENLSAKQIVERMTKAYADCKSYQDSGVVTTMFFMADRDRTTERPFTTAFVRPDRFRFEYKENDGSTKPSRYIIWSSSKDIQTWWDVRPGIEKPKSMQLALAAATGVSGGSSHTIPSLLLPGKVGASLSAMTIPKRVQDGNLGKVECFRIEGTLGNQPCTVWIDKKSYLLRRIDEQTQFDDFRTEQTTTYNPVINEEISDKTLAFAPPTVQVKTSNKAVPSDQEVPTHSSKVRQAPAKMPVESPKVVAESLPATSEQPVAKQLRSPVDVAAVAAARKVLEEVAAAYNKMDTYKAEGTAKIDMDTGATKMDMETSFSIELKKPNLYRISWTQKNDKMPGITQAGAVWSDGTQPYLYMEILHAYSKMQSDDFALGAASGCSGGAAMTMPSLFLSVFKQSQMPLARLIAPKIEATENIDGEDCYVVSGPSSISEKETFWISKSRHIILKCSRSLVPPKGHFEIPEMTDKQIEETVRNMGMKVTDENKKNMRERMTQMAQSMKAIKINGTSTEVYRNLSSPSLKKGDFIFTPPKDAKLKESLFGDILSGKSMANTNVAKKKTPIDLGDLQNKASSQNSDTQKKAVAIENELTEELVQSTANKDGSFTFKLKSRTGLVSEPQQSFFVRFLTLSDKPLKRLNAEPKYQSPKPLYGELELGIGPENKFAVVVDGLNGPKPRIYVDRNRDRDLTNDGSGEDISNVVIDVPYPSGTLPYSIRFMPRNSHNSVAYRSNSRREGNITLDGKQYKIAIQDDNFDGRFDDLEHSVLLIDVNRDGIFQGNRYVTGDFSSSEIFKLKEPFNIHGKVWQVASVSPNGLTITIRPSTAKVDVKLDLTPGNKAPDFTVKDLDGNPIHLKQEAAKTEYVLLHFWQSSNRYSQLQCHIFRKLYAQYKDHGLQIIGISEDQDASAVRNAMKEYSLTYPQVLVPNDSKSVKRLYRVLGYAQSYLIDRNMTITARGNSEIADKLQALLGPGDEQAAAKVEKESVEFEKKRATRFAHDASIYKTYSNAKGFDAVVVPRPAHWDQCDVRAVALHLPYVYILSRASADSTTDRPNLLIGKISTDAKGSRKVEFVGTMACINDGTDLLVWKDALLCPRHGGIAVYSLSDPAHPTFVRLVPSDLSMNDEAFTFGPGTLLVQNDNLFLLSQKRLFVFDAAKSLSPRFLTTLPVHSGFFGGCIVEGRIYGASSFQSTTGGNPSGISIYDISKPQEPKELGRVQTGDGLGDELIYQLLPVDSKRLVATTTRAISLYSLENPLKPTLIGTPVKFDKPSGRSAAMFAVGGRSFAIVNGTVYSVEGHKIIKYGDFTWGGNADGFPYRAAIQDNCIAITSGAFVTLLFADSHVLKQPAASKPNAAGSSNNATQPQKATPIKPKASESP